MRHEAWLNEQAEAEVMRVRAEVQQSLCVHEARQHQLALASRNTVMQGEAQFMENAESEMKQFGTYVMSFSHSEYREQLEQSTLVVQRYFELQYQGQVRELDEEYRRLLTERSTQLRDECHAELLTAESHVGKEWHQALAQLAMSENRVALADRQVSDIESSIEQHVKVVTSRE